MTTKPPVAEVERLRRAASAAKSLLSRRYNEMNEALRNSECTFTDYLQAVERYKEQEDVFGLRVFHLQTKCAAQRDKRIIPITANRWKSNGSALFIMAGSIGSLYLHRC